MKWAVDATVSEDSRLFTGYYKMDETKVTILGKQNLVAVLKVLGEPSIKVNGLRAVVSLNLETTTVRDS